MNDPQLENSHDLSYATNITNITAIPEFSQNDGTYELAVKMNAYDFKLYRHAIFRNCVVLNKAKTTKECLEYAKNVKLRYSD